MEESDKTAVVGIWDRNTMRAGPVPETTKARLEYFVESSIVKDSKVYADGDGEYGGLAKRETVNRRNGGYVRERCPLLAP